MRLFAALGPGDIVAAQRNLLSRGEIANVTSIIFSGQLFEYCSRQGIDALFTSTNHSIDALEAQSIKLINLPRKLTGRNPFSFHISRIMYAFRLAVMARRFRADFALIDSGTCHYFALCVFRLIGIPVAINFHNVRWPQGFTECGLSGRVIRRLDSWFFRRIAIGALGCSPECAIQARSGGADALPYFGWSAQFSRSGFPRSTDVVGPRRPLRLMFAGRIERNKGVFDLIEISALLKQRYNVDVIIDIYGDGSAFGELCAAVSHSTEADRIILHGKKDRESLLKAYSRAHVVVVPTRRDFCEGMPLVCAEAVLSGRPVVTSRLSNAIPVLGDAVAEALPEDTDSYARVICRLANDDQYYQRAQSACATVSRQFLDRQLSYAAALDRLFAQVINNWQTLDDYNCLFDRLDPPAASNRGG